MTECCSEDEEDGDVAVELIKPGARQNVGYRLGLRNVLSERRKRVADYSLVCALFGLVVVIVETEMSLAQLYDKVRTRILTIIHKLLCSSLTYGTDEVAPER